MAGVLFPGGCGCERAFDRTSPADFTQLGVTLRIDPVKLSIEVGDEEGRGGALVAGPDGFFRVGLRADEDEGRFHKPGQPDEDLIWLFATSAVWSGPEQESLTIQMESKDGKQKAVANLAVPEGDKWAEFFSLDFSVDVPDRDVALIAVDFELREGEHVVGGGERFGGVDLLGRVIPLYFAIDSRFDSGLNESHAPVPFFTTNKGLSALFETERPGAFDVGHTDEGRLTARFHGNALALRLIAGEPAENVAAHNRLMGLPPLPPRWIFAPQQWRNDHHVDVDAEGNVTRSGQDRFNDDAAAMRDLFIASTAMWIDAPWSTGHNTFEFNTVQFPDPPAIFSEAERLGYRIIVWATEHLNRSEDSGQMVGMPEHGSLELFQHFGSKGWLVQDANGDPLVLPWGRGQGGHVDFTVEEARRAYIDLMDPLIASGVRGFKLDYGESMRPELLGLSAEETILFGDGTTTEVQHTRYARLYHETYIEALERHHPDDWFIITRTGGIYDQKNGTTIWPGDLDVGWKRHLEILDDGKLAVGGLPAAISGGLSLGMSGYPLYGSDIGGYRGGPLTDELHMRWTQYASMFPVMQLGGGAGNHNPWHAEDFSPETLANYQRYARLHMDLLPLWETLTLWAATTGYPPIQPAGLFFDHEDAWADPDAFVVGERIFVAPVVEEGATTRTFHLGEGTWVNYLDGSVLEGPGSHTVDAPVDTLPVYVRAGAVIPRADPRLQTLVEAEDPSVGDPEQFGNALVVWTTAGPDDVLRTSYGTELTQTQMDDATVEVAVKDHQFDRIVVILQTHSAGGPHANSIIQSGAVSESADLDAFWNCASVCAYREDGRLYYSATEFPITSGTTHSITVRFGG
jgi:alpha-D-xyloside xylohydrolase